MKFKIKIEEEEKLAAESKTVDEGSKEKDTSHAQLTQNESALPKKEPTEEEVS